MSDTKAAELLLIDCRPDAPLVRTKGAYYGFPAGTLGFIEGVSDGYVMVRLAGSNESYPMLSQELTGVA